MNLKSREDWRALAAGVKGSGRLAEAGDLGKANWKLLGSLGHVMARFWEAQRLLKKRGGRDQTALNHWLELAPEPGVIPAEFELVVMVTERGIRWLGVWDEEMGWANEAIWPALLRLPALNEFWRQHLRGNVLETLLKVLPQAWLMEKEPLPPGAVIAGLEISDWGQLEKVEGTFEKDPRQVLSKLEDGTESLLVVKYGTDAKGIRMVEVKMAASAD